MHSVIVWHCGPQKIEQFHIPCGGLHLGSYESALCAGERKSSTELYMHKCRISFSTVIDVQDAGNSTAWDEEIAFSSPHYDVLRYINRYEPSTSPSYVVMNERCSIEILSITVLVLEEEDV